jgi:hypothetical protein
MIQFVELEDGSNALIIDIKDNIFTYRNPDRKILRDLLKSNAKGIRNRCIYSEDVERSTPTAPTVKIATLSNNLKVHAPGLWRASLVSAGLMCKEPSCLGMLGVSNKSGFCQKCIEKTPARRNRPNYYQRLQQESLQEHLKSNTGNSELLNKLTPDCVNQIIKLFGEDKVDIAIQLAILPSPVYKQEIKMNILVMDKIVQIITDLHFNKKEISWNPVAIKDSWLSLSGTAQVWLDNAGLSDWKQRQIIDRIKQIYLPQDFTP